MTVMRNAFVVLCLLILSLSLAHTSSRGTTLLAKSETPSSSAPRVVDLSYLYRTQSSLLAQAFREVLLQYQGEEDDDDYLDVDLSSSFVEKSIQDLVSSLATETIGPRPRRQFGIIAQHNQWTITEANLLLQAIIGPEEEGEGEGDTITSNHSKPKSGPNETSKKRKKRRRKEDLDSSQSIESIRLSNAGDLLGNKTVTLSSNVTSVVENISADSNSTNTTKESIDQGDNESVSNFTVLTKESIDQGDNESVKHVTVSTKESKDQGDNVPVINVTISTSNISRGEVERLTLMEEPSPPILLSQGVVRLDLGYNDLGGSSVSGKENKKSLKAWYQMLLRTVKNRDRCPTVLRFPVCGLGPAACRAIGKGLIARYANTKSDGDSDLYPLAVPLPPPLSLYLTRNEAIGDPGVAALSAAIRTVTTQNRECTILDTLDLSGCGITDTGAEALAVALEQNPLCVRHLNLSNNQITNIGAAALGRALAMRDGDRHSKIATLDLSNNKGIEDAGAKALALALQNGGIDTLILRSCHVYADGAAALVKSLKTLALSKHRLDQIQLDLSGNPLGILRKKPKSGGGKYSAAALRDKATATTAAYMSLIGKTVQKGLKDLGISEGGNADTLESDDEEDAQMNEKDQDDDPSKVKCGALAMADALLLDDDEEEVDADEEQEATTTICKIQLGLRHCALDTRASEALAAIRQELLSSSAKMDVVVDVQMNHVLEDDTIAALRGDDAFTSDLNAMAERYLEAMEALRITRQRSTEAAKVARSRMQIQDEMDDFWGSEVPMGDEDYPLGYDKEDGGWDSDADYDQEEDIEEFY